MTSRTTHVIPKDDGWAVRKEGLARSAIVYSTQKQALEAARRVSRRSATGQIVIHLRDGTMRRRDVRGLPRLRPSAVKSDLGTRNIEKAVSATIRERLERE